MQNNKTDNKNLIPLIAALLVTIAYLVFELVMAPSFPVADDYISLVKAYIAFTESSSLSERIAILFEPHNVHYLVFNNAIAYIHAALGIPLHFYWLILLGCLARALSFWVIIYIFLTAFRDRGYVAQMALVGACFFFNLKSWQTNNFAMMTLSSNFGWLFGLAAIALANRVNSTFLQIFLCFCLSTFAALTITTAIPCIVPVAMLLFIRNPGTGHRIFTCLLFVAQALFIAYLLSLSLENPTQAELPDIFADATLLERGAAYIHFLASLIGYYWLDQPIAAAIIGYLSLISGASICILFLRQKKFELIAIYLFVVGAAAIITAGRYSVNPELSSEWRYLICTEVYWLVFALMVLAAITGLFRHTEKALLASLAAIAMFYSGFSFGHYLHDLIQYRETGESDLRNLGTGVSTLLPMYWLGTEATDHALEAQKYGAVDFSDAIPDYAEAEILSTCDSDGYSEADVSVQKIGTNKFDAHFVKLQVLVRAKRFHNTPVCAFRSCSSEPVQSFDATTTLNEENQKYQLSAVVGKQFQLANYKLFCDEPFIPPDHEAPHK